MRKRLGLIAFVSWLLITIVGTGALLVAQTTWFKSWALDRAIAIANENLEGELSVGSLHGNWLTGVGARDLRVTLDGKPVIEVASAEVRYRLFSVIHGGLPALSIELTKPRIHLDRTEEGLNVARLVRTRETDGPGADFSIPRLVLRDGLVTIAKNVVTADGINVPARLENLNGTLAIAQDDGRLSIVIDQMSGHARDPELAIQGLSGVVTVGDEAVQAEDIRLETAMSTIAADLRFDREREQSVSAEVKAEPLHLQEWTAIVPALARYESLDPRVRVEAHGTLAALDVDFNVATGEGRAAGRVRVDAEAPGRTVDGRIEVEQLNLALLVPLEERAVVSGEATLRGQLDERTVQFDARLQAFGGSTVAGGSVTIPQNGDPIAFEIAGSVKGIHVASLPEPLRPPFGSAPAGQTVSVSPVSLDFNATSNGKGLAVDAELERLQFAGATLERGTRVHVARTHGGALSYAAHGRVLDLNITRVSEALGFDAVQSPRLPASLDASFDLSRVSTGPEGATLIGTITVEEAPLPDVRISDATIDLRVERGSGPITVRARFADVNPGALAERPEFAGTAGGHIDATVTVADLGTDAFDWRSDLEGTAIANLGEGEVGGVLIDEGVVSVTYADGSLKVEQLEITGPDLRASASGHVTLDESGESSLSFSIDTPPLSWISGLPVNMHGEARIDGTLTGNRTEYRSEGKASGTEVGYGNYGALRIEGTYRLTVPYLDFVQSSVSATFKAIRVEIGERLLREVSGDVEYQNTQLAFDGRAADNEREFDLSGRVAFHPDHNEVHLQRFSMGATGSRWSLSPGTQAAIQYDERGFNVAGLSLQSDQGGTVTADGGLGPIADRSLQVVVRGLPLGSVDDFILSERDLAGALDVDATIAGSLDAPTVDAMLTVTKGGVAGFQFERLAGVVAYKGGRVADVDLRLDAMPGAWVTAKGRVPLSRDVSDGLDVRLQSPQIDLSVLSALTPEVSKATGMVALDVSATGSLDDPQFEGLIAINAGALTLTALQTTYTGLQTNIELTPELITIPELMVLDEEGDPMRIAGKLAYRGTMQGELAVFIESDGFELMDNPLGELEIGTDLHVSGRLNELYIGGQARIASGTINVDEVLALLDRPYSTRPAANDEEDKSSEPSGMSVVAEVQLEIRDTLRLTGRDLRAPGRRSSPAIGDINLTIGGDLYVFAQPGRTPLVVGEVHPVRGTYEFQGRQFELSREGTIAFEGVSPGDPRLDVVASRLVSGVETRVHVGGTLRAPTLRLSSDPPLEQADILSLIVFNQPVNMLGTGERVSLARRGASVAAGFVTSQLAESISDTLEIDVFDIDIGASTAPQVTLGEQFGEGLFLKLRQQFGSSSLSTAVLEYQLTDFLRFEGELSHGDQSAGRALLQHAERGGVYLIFRYGF